MRFKGLAPYLFALGVACNTDTATKPEQPLLHVLCAQKYAASG